MKSDPGNKQGYLQTQKIKNVLKTVRSWLFEASIAAGFGGAAIVVYSLWMWWHDFSFGETIGFPLIIGSMFGVFFLFIWLLEKIHYLWLFPLYALTLVGSGYGFWFITESSRVVTFGEAVLVVLGLIVLPMAVSVQRERRRQSVNQVTEKKIASHPIPAGSDSLVKEQCEGEPKLSPSDHSATG